MHNHSFVTSISSVSDYKKIRTIGQGGFGVVYEVKAKATESQLHYAMKEVKIREDQIDDLQYLQNLFEEFMLCKSLSHENIIKAIDQFYEDGVYYIIEELADINLTFFIKQVHRNLNWQHDNYDLIFSCCSQVTSAIAYLHENRIVHRDIKPDNILVIDLHDNYKYKICDFGIAKKLLKQSTITQMGTQWYMAPERLNGEPYSYEADIWSLGCVVYELCTGLVAFSESKQQQYFCSKSSQLVLDDQQYQSVIHHKFRNLISQMLKNNKDHRPTAVDIYKQLQNNEQVYEYIYDQKDFENIVYDYYGNVLNNQPCGNGIAKYKNSELNMYQGGFVCGQREGIGRLVFQNGEMQLGAFVHGQMNGCGISLHDSVGKYYGEYRNGLQNGFGVQKYLNGSMYIGEWMNGKINGIGKLIFEDKSTYFGTFVQSVRSGYGQSVYCNEDLYFGQYSNNQKNGIGVFTWANGDRYKGEFQNSEISGLGVKIFKRGSIYDGCWCCGKFHGDGTLKLSNGDKLIGKWENNELKHGTIYFANKDSYIGQISHYLPHGKGKMIYSNGGQYDGEWSCGVKQGQGIYNWDNGSNYNGQFTNDDRNGSGEFFNSQNGSTEIGKYKNDKQIGVHEGIGKDGSKYWHNYDINKITIKGDCKSM